MSKHRFVIGAAVAVGLLACGYWLLSRSPHDVAKAGEATAPLPQSVPATPAPAETPPLAPATRPRVPLPAPGAPIDQIADALKARADSGDSQAACRLAVELLRCTYLEEAKGVQWLGGNPELLMEKRGNIKAADQYAEMEIRKIQLGQHCQALDPALIKQAPRYLAAAALSGEPEAMLRYAIGTHHGLAGQAFMSDPDFDQWRREAPGMLLRAAQSGRMEAVHYLDQAYRDDHTPLAGLIPNDPLRAHAWALLAFRLRGVERPALESAAAVDAQATALAAQWHQRYFDNAVIGTDRAAMNLPSLDMPLRPLEEDPVCE